MFSTAFSFDFLSFIEGVILQQRLAKGHPFMNTPALKLILDEMKD